ncbi:MAG: hypothetical protein GKR94_08265 [Gammaproteobacteria bacterium]|nr:hypothetical protein [Gammaproteobacteria bacterium]
MPAQAIDYAASPYAIRNDLATAHQRAWRRLSRPGTWLSGEQRIAIAQEARHASHCTACRAIATSVAATATAHDSCAPIDPVWVEVVHRVRTDASRLTDTWLQSLLSQGLSIAEFVEIVGVVATVTALDSFTDALSLERHLLPDPLPGAPVQILPSGAKPGLGRVPTVAPEDVTEEEADLYEGLSGAHIHRALSLVPAEVRGFFELDTAMYLPDARLRDFGHQERALSHAQIELLAARVSALNRCYY